MYELLESDRVRNLARDGQGAAAAAPQPDLSLALALDEIDYGVVLVDAQGRTLHANHSARSELRGDHPLCLQADGRLVAGSADDARSLAAALADARQGKRRMLTLGQRSQRVSLAVVPLPRQPDQAGERTALILGKREVCEPLSLQCFAHSHDLTLAETRVLGLLCNGVAPGAIARELGVATCTVRTHLSAIRAKTGSPNLQALLRRVAALPPMLGVVRH